MTDEGSRKADRRLGLDTDHVTERQTGRALDGPAPAPNTSQEEVEEEVAVLEAGGRRVADGDTRQGRTQRGDRTDEDGIEGPNSA